MAQNMDARLAACESAIADMRAAITSDSRRIAKLEAAMSSKPSTKRASKVAEPVKAVSKKWKRDTRCKMRGCDRMFFSNVGARSHRCAA